MKTLTRDDTEHGKEYVLKSDAEAALEQQAAEIAHLQLDLQIEVAAVAAKDAEIERLKAERDALQAPSPQVERQEPFGYFCEWKTRVGYPPTQALYYGEPGGATKDDWNCYPEVHHNVPLYTAPKVAQPLTTAEVKDLTAMVFGAPCTDEIMEWLPLVIAQYEALIAANKRPVDPVDEAAHNIGGQQP